MKVEEYEDSPLLMSRQKDPFQKAKLFGRLFGAWTFPLVFSGIRKYYSQDDMYKLREKDSSEHSYQIYNHYYQRLRKDDQYRVIKSLTQAFWKNILVVLILYLILKLLYTLNPFFIKRAQLYFNYKDQKPSDSSMFIFISVQTLYMISQTILNPSSHFEQKLLSIYILGALQTQIFKKTLTFPILRNNIYNPGDLINLIQIDTQQAGDFFYNCIMVILTPIQFLTALYVYFDTLGYESIPGGISALIQVTIGITYGYLYGILQNKFMHAKDIRLRSTDEALLNIKQIKMNSLEHYFEERLDQKRKQELRWMKYEIILQILIQFILQILQIVTHEVSFYYAKNLDFNFIGLIISNYASVSNSLQIFPRCLKDIIVNLKSINRIQLFCEQESMLCLNGSFEQEENNIALKIENGNFTWKTNLVQDQNTLEYTQQEKEAVQNQNPFNLSNINMEVKKGDLVAIIGNSGSGKSSLMQSILGEMLSVNDSSYFIDGKCSIATQQPWILSGTIRENITYQQRFDQKRYQQVINVCGLKNDLNQFQEGDQLMIGEKGDNLSGGQQKRINLARCIYQESDLYLIDDPLSSLDIRVKLEIMDQCILGYLKNKTRIMFSNSLSNLQQADNIYLMDKGQIVQSGSYEDIIKYIQCENVMNLNIHKRIQQYEDIDQSIKDQDKDVQFENKYYDTNNQSISNQEVQLIQKEDQQSGSIKSKVILNLFKYQGGWITIVFTFIFLALHIIPSVKKNELLGNMIQPQEDKSKFLFQYFLLQVPIVTGYTFVYGIFLVAGFRTSILIHKQMINRLLKASIVQFYNRILLGRLLNRLGKDIYKIDILMPPVLSAFFTQFGGVITILASGVLYLNILALPFMISYLIIIMTFTYIYFVCLREATRIETVSKSPIYSYFNQIIRGLVFARNCLSHDKLLKQHQKNLDLDLSNSATLYGVQQWYAMSGGIVSALFYMGLFIYCFYYPGETRTLTYLIIQQLVNLTQMLNTITFSYGTIQIYLVSFERCHYLANDIETENYDDGLSPSFIDQQSQHYIQFENASYKYRTNNVLNSLNVAINSSSKVGVVGRTGAGKSSIIMALTRIIQQTQGSLYILGIDASTLNLKTLRSIFSIIPQDPLIFEGTLRDNLDPLQQFHDQELESIVEKCKLNEMKNFKNKGLDSFINVNGANLSIGEKQLVVIGRTLLMKKKIILVDEATANIDKNSEMLISRIFDEYLSNRCVVSIAHKITTIMNSDQIIVLENGKVIEYDSPQNLMTNPKTEFAQIVRMNQRFDDFL